jgi:hypothetical protein
MRRSDRMEAPGKKQVQFTPSPKLPQVGGERGGRESRDSTPSNRRPGSGLSEDSGEAVNRFVSGLDTRGC